MATRDIYRTTFDEDVSTDTTTCPECNGRVRMNTAETVCEDCGLVVDEQRIDHGPEWQSFSNNEEPPERTGALLTIARHDRGLSTKIGRRTDANGNDFSGRKRRQLARLRREQSRGRFQSKAERNLAHGLGEVRRIASALKLADSVRNQACQLFRSAQSEELLRGRSIEGVAAASVYGMCRCNGRSRTLEDITDVARIEQSRVATAYKTLNAELGLPTQPARPREFVPRLTTELDVPDPIRRRAVALAKQTHGTAISNGCQPTGVAAACVYKAAREHGWSLTQERVADAAGTSVVTVRTR